MSHLEELAAALVDDELTYEQRDRALVHLAGCAECRHRVETERRTKAALRALPAPAPSRELLDRLALVPLAAETAAAIAPAMPRRTAAAPAVAVTPARPAAPVRPAAASARPGGPLAVRGPGRDHARPGAVRHRRRVAVGSVSALAVACGVAVMLGGGESGPAVRPPVANFVQDHGATTRELPFNDPASVVLVSFP